MIKISSKLLSVLDLAGAELLSGTYTGGDAKSLLGTDSIEAECIATFDAATGLSAISFRFAVSDDGTNWQPIASVLLSTGDTATDQAIAASAGTTVIDHIATTSHRNAQYVRVEAEGVDSAGAGTDAATANLTYSE
jgi:hypothetical protein